MELTLQQDEALLVKQILIVYLSDLRSEISNTEDYELRQALKRDEESLKTLIDRLEQLSPALR